MHRTAATAARRARRHRTARPRQRREVRRVRETIYVKVSFICKIHFGGIFGHAGQLFVVAASCFVAAERRPRRPSHTPPEKKKTGGLLLADRGRQGNMVCDKNKPGACVRALLFKILLFLPGGTEPRRQHVLPAPTERLSLVIENNYCTLPLLSTTTCSPYPPTHTVLDQHNLKRSLTLDTIHMPARSRRPNCFLRPKVLGVLYGCAGSVYCKGPTPNPAYDCLTEVRLERSERNYPRRAHALTHKQPAFPPSTPSSPILRFPTLVGGLMRSRP